MSFRNETGFSYIKTFWQPRRKEELFQLAKIHSSFHLHLEFFFVHDLLQML